MCTFSADFAIIKTTDEYTAVLHESNDLHVQVLCRSHEERGERDRGRRTDRDRQTQRHRESGVGGGGGGQREAETERRGCR